MRPTPPAAPECRSHVTAQLQKRRLVAALAHLLLFGCGQKTSAGTGESTEAAKAGDQNEASGSAGADLAGSSAIAGSDLAEAQGPPHVTPAADRTPSVLVGQACVPVCKSASGPTETGSDWSYEDGGSCIANGTVTSANQACVIGQPPPALESRPGVVRAGECVALCQIVITPTDPGAPDWSYENNAPCILTGTKTALSESCLTGQPLPDLNELKGRPGVVVLGGDEAKHCAALCTFEGSAPGIARDDWDYEFEASCVVPGSATAARSQPCLTGEPLPAPEPRPGIFVNSDPAEGSCRTTACVPLCTVVTTPWDPAYPDWGWEFNESCVLAGSSAATVVGGDSTKSIKDHGYEVPPRGCTFGAPRVDYFAPPPLDPGRLTAPTFTTDGPQLLDPYGNPFVIHAINNSNGWYDICGQYAAFDALTAIAQTGANAVRIGWAFESIDPGGPDSAGPKKKVVGTHPALLAEILYRTVELGMIPLVAFNDSTGQVDPSWPQKMAKLLTSGEYLRLFQAYEQYLLLGVANELNVGDTSPTVYAASYKTAINTLRAAGLDMTLVITANRWGQGCDNIIEVARDMIAADPKSNLLFDLHIYSYLQYFIRGANNEQAGPEAVRVRGCLNTLKDLDVPTLVGEFGFFHGEGKQREAVAWESIIATCDANGQGYAPWLWYGDAEYSELNLNRTWSGPLTPWGRDAVSSLRNSPKASILR